MEKNIPQDIIDSRNIYTRGLHSNNGCISDYNILDIGQTYEDARMDERESMFEFIAYFLKINPLSEVNSEQLKANHAIWKRTK